jgi:hypothetical protein
VVDAATGYRLYRKTGSGAYVEIYAGTAASYTDRGVVNGTSYTYAVTAYDGDQESDYSAEASVTPVVTPPAGPEVPAGLSATAGDTNVAITWSAVDGATGYRVYRRTGAGAYTELYDGTATSYSDTAVVNGTGYTYVVTAYDNDQESEYSAEASATPTGSASGPTVPAQLPAAGLIMLLDAENAALEWSNGSEVTLWRDASTGGNDAVTASGTAPILQTGAIGGHPVVKFDGQNDYLNLPTGFENFTAGMSLFVVARPLVLQPGFKLVALGNGGGADNLVLGRNGSSGAGFQYFTTNSSGSYQWFVTQDALTTGEPALYSVIQAGGSAGSSVSASVSRNGIAIGSGSVYVPPVTSRTVNYVGRSYWNEGRFEGEIAEIIIYNRALTASEQAEVNAYLMQKYLLTE